MWNRAKAKRTDTQVPIIQAHQKRAEKKFDDENESNDQQQNTTNNRWPLAIARVTDGVVAACAACHTPQMEHVCAQEFPF